MSEHNSDSLETYLQNLLHRFNCPDATTLGEYHLGLVDKQTQTVITKHLTTCHRCQTDLTNLADFLASDDKGFADERETTSPTTHTIIPLQRMQTSVVKRGKKTPLQAQLAAGITLYITIQRTLQDYKLQAQLDVDTEQANPLTGALVEIWQSDNLVATTFIDDVNTFNATIPTDAAILIRIQAEESYTLSYTINNPNKNE